MKAQLEYKGIDQLMRHLKKAATLNDVQKVVKSNTAEMTERMQKGAPVDTGYLRRSINMKSFRSWFNWYCRTDSRLCSLCRTWNSLYVGTALC